MICRDLLEAGFCVLASVTTDYGAQCLPTHKRLAIHIGKMDAAQMETWMSQNVACVVDATHPYAREASQNAKAACAARGVPYIRVQRPQSAIHAKHVHSVQSAEEAAQYLSGKKGNVLLTTGSRTLETFVRHIDDPNRLIARILPDAHFMQQAQQLGFSARQIIAMQGPFSKEMNEAMIRAVDARYLVSKDSGVIGGLQEKLDAAQACDIRSILIERPPSDENAIDAENILDKVREAIQKEEKRLPTEFKCVTNKKSEKQTYDIEGFFPFFVDIKGWKAVVIGGGQVAARRIRQLCRAGADITVIAPSVSDEIPNTVTKIKRPWKRGDTANAKIVLAATDSVAINRAVITDSAHACFKNTCNEPFLGNFFFPALHKQAHMCIGLISGDARRSKDVMRTIRKNLWEME